MNIKHQSEGLGTPDLQVAGLQLWIHSRQFPGANDFEDGNWLSVTVHCGASGADVWVSGSILHLSELHQWMTACEQVYTLLQGEANMACIEPALAIAIQMTPLGQASLTVWITPDPLHQEHRFAFDIDSVVLSRVN